MITSDNTTGYFIDNDQYEEFLLESLYNRDVIPQCSSKEGCEMISDFLEESLSSIEDREKFYIGFKQDNVDAKQSSRLLRNYLTKISFSEKIINKLTHYIRCR